MDRLPEKARVGHMAVDLLIVAVVWNVLLLLMDYPREDWIGVVAVGCVAFWVARAIVSFAFVRIMKHGSRRFRELAESQGIELPDPPTSMKSLPLEVKLWVLALLLPLVCAFTAVSVILTSIVIGFASLTPLASMTVPVSAAVVAVGVGIPTWQLGRMYFVLFKLERQLNPEKMHSHGQYVTGLGRLTSGNEPLTSWIFARA